MDVGSSLIKQVVWFMLALWLTYMPFSYTPGKYLKLRLMQPYMENEPHTRYDTKKWTRGLG